MMIFFDSWLSLGRTLIIGVFTYLGLIILLRISGKRTLSKMNAFDLVVTVALGSTLATALLSKSTALIDGLFALALLIFLQYSVASFSTRSRTFRKLVKSEPTLVFFRGNFLDENLKKQRLLAEEVLSAIRSQGVLDVNQLEAVVLETDGSFSVIKKSSQPIEKNALHDVLKKEHESGANQIGGQ